MKKATVYNASLRECFMRTILVVDDDKENLKSLKMFLSREYKVAAVCTGEDALAVSYTHLTLPTNWCV